jgi:hypothetical protein
MSRSSKSARKVASNGAPSRPSQNAESGPSAARSAFDDVLRDAETQVHPFVFCPPLAAGTRYLLVRKSPNGQLHVLHAAQATSRHPVSNLAHLRFIGANLGATEAHLLVTKPAASSTVVRLPHRR